MGCDHITDSQPRLEPDPRPDCELDDPAVGTRSDRAGPDVCRSRERRTCRDRRAGCGVADGLAACAMAAGQTRAEADDEDEEAEARRAAPARSLVGVRVPHDPRLA